MKIPLRNVYYLLCYAWGRMDESDLVDATALDRFEQVHDLLGKVLSEGTFRLVRRGIDRGYREVTREVAGVRGKLRVSAMATTAVRARSRTICTFEEFSPDVIHNRIIRSTLDALLRTGDLHPEVRNDVALAYQKLQGVQTLRVTRQLFRRVQLDRNQRDYRFLLQVCQLIHDSLLIDERSGDVKFRDFRKDENEMWRLFEGFVLEFYRVEQDHYRVLGQRKVPWHGLEGRTATDEGFIPGMYADVVLESPARRIILDTKFYQEPLSKWHGAEKLRSGNLYQLLSYLENRQGSHPAGPYHEGVLLYAAVERSFHVDVTLRGFRIQARTVDLSRTWQEISRELLEVVGEGRVDEQIQDGDQILVDEFVRVGGDSGGVTVAVRIIEWEGPHSPVSSWRIVRRLGPEPPREEVDRAIASVLNDERFFRICATCREKNPNGWMHGTSLCQACAEAQGLVYRVPVEFAVAPLPEPLSCICARASPPEAVATTLQTRTATASQRRPLHSGRLPKRRAKEGPPGANGTFGSVDRAYFVKGPINR